MSTRNKIIIIVVAVILAGGLFYGGFKVGEAKTTSARGQFAAGAGFTRGQGGAGGQFRGVGNANGTGGLIAGTIIASDNKSITIQIPTGGSKIVFTSSSTNISKQAAGSLTDLTVGTSVAIQGSTNSDGSVTAQSIQIRPAGFNQRGATTTSTQ